MKVEYIIETIRITRRNFLDMLEGCDIEKLNRIPAGFSNNLVWNFGHVMASMQSLCYERSGFVPRVDQSLVDAYKPQTFPEKFVDEARFEIIKEAVINSVDMLKDDYETGIFKNYTERQTKFGVLITNIDEAISYVSTHETLHLGYAKALLRVL